MKLLAVTVCVNYSDYLSFTWEKNKATLSKYDFWVITDSRDAETHLFCAINGINCFVTDTFYQNDNPFNKGAALNAFFLSDSINFDELEWILLMDSDIILNKSIEDFEFFESHKTKDLKKNLYSCSRKVYRTKKDYLENKYRWEVCHFIGYFQLFHKEIIESKIKNKEGIFVEFYNSAVYDMEFAKSFGDKKVGLSDVCHLGEPCQNWDGRKTANFLEDEPIPEEEITFDRSELLALLEEAKDMLFKSPEELNAFTNKMIRNTEKFARINCPVYRDKNMVSKSDLENKNEWYVDLYRSESRHVTTSGTTTGMPFEYMRWEPSFHRIEWDYHYNLVLDEFDIPQNFELLYFSSQHYKFEDNKFIYCPGGPSDMYMNNHGTGRTPNVHYVNFRKYTENQEEFFKHLFEYLTNHKIDVVFTSAPQINSMCNYISKFNVKEKLAYLLSNTCERLLQQDAKFLIIDNQYFDHICDHMRCWDGGATFFTCKHMNYHLMDNLAWTEEVDGMMVSTDYFNPASPFYKYWNGDYCKIAKEYKRCECGRLYREFEFAESRPFSLKGVCLKDVKEKVKAMGIKGIKQVRCSVSHLDVVTNRELTPEEKAAIISSTDKFEFRFSVEDAR